MKKDLRDFELDELVEVMKTEKIPAFRGKQIFEWIHKGVASFDDMNNIPKNLKASLDENYMISNMKVVEVMKSSSDGTRKYLLQLQDGNVIECVFMKYKHGNTLCISTQVGCRMKCSFCASTIHGLERQLSAGEMLGQIFTVQADTGERISNVVLMGSGEPLDNYDNVMKFLRLVNHPKGLNISMRSITLSTCGLVPKIKELIKEKLQLTLAISLHATSDEKRSTLMPVNKSYPIKELLDVCKEYTKFTGRRITFEYALIASENDSEEEAHKLGKLLKDIHCHVNLIPINPVKEKDYKATSNENARAFQAVLKKYHIEATIRRELGSDIDAACGQLRNKHIDTTL
ncbi:23S rRNA (adenine(2503)-C(2))-methyltransferase RlmN [Acidaminobacter sp. JC074]|uniref:23S rRNA (adenine(2503)-C(2))-methyltransferase RlmN n=1 Tax=Acidaminobacter sp. JC074 TaxID=2530199 RepID=UPI001F0E84B9|nr:23S rRNA (adenine(2503)-C(2))-methyltransferase RlmN [Acidaminobacter sp. JC074]MCH4890729.1 23S rRNA (adenine(2503)-C(2))-methyltransferase RlmN [Acidaminobacter sp. JC074]